jgi:hypothetical protein
VWLTVGGNDFFATGCSRTSLSSVVTPAVKRAIHMVIDNRPTSVRTDGGLADGSTSAPPMIHILVTGYSASAVASACGGEAGAPGAQLLIALNSAIETAVDMVNSAVAADINPSVDLKFIPFSAGDTRTHSHAVEYVLIAPEGHLCEDHIIAY